MKNNEYYERSLYECVVAAIDKSINEAFESMDPNDREQLRKLANRFASAKSKNGGAALQKPGKKEAFAAEFQDMLLKVPGQKDREKLQKIIDMLSRAQSTQSGPSAEIPQNDYEEPVEAPAEELSGDSESAEGSDTAEASDSSEASDDSSDERPVTLQDIADAAKKYLVDNDPAVLDPQRQSRYEPELESTKPAVKIDAAANTVYAWPMVVYSDFGPRKIKTVPTEWWWRYKIYLRSDGSVDFGYYGGGYNTAFYLNFNKAVVNFIQNAGVKINEYYTYTTGWYKYPAFEKIEYAKRSCIFMSGFMPRIKNTQYSQRAIPDDIKLSDKFVQNFPNTITTRNDINGSSPEQTPCSLYKGMFTSNNQYFKVVNTLVKAGYKIQDEDSLEYDAANIGSYMTGQKSANVASAIDPNAVEDWLNNLLGSDYMAKYDKVKDHMLNNVQRTNTHFYLKVFNGGFRKEGMKLDWKMMAKLAAVNGKDLVKWWRAASSDILKNESGWEAVKDDSEKCHAFDMAYAMKEWDDYQINSVLGKSCMYAVDGIVRASHPNGWRVDSLSFEDYFIGKEHDMGWTSSIGSCANFGDLDIALDEYKQLYYIFQAAAKAVQAVQLSGVPEYEEEGIQKFIAESIRNAAVSGGDPDMDNFDFGPMADTLKAMIDGYIKKYKLK